jgi:virginiamycin B lyase
MILGDGLSKWDRETKKVTTYAIPESITGGHGSLPYGVVADNSDNIWIALARRGKIVKFDTKTDQFSEYVSPTNPAFIRRLNVDSKNNIWFPIYSSGELVRLDQATGKMKTWRIPAQFSQPYDVQEYDGKIWIADDGQESTLIQFDPQTEKFTFFPSPQPNADKPKIQITREGAIWYSPRSSRDYPGFGVLYPDMDKMTTFAAQY